ncbi:MAG: hypothetical protein JETT_0270 [Candidatus Jettenia ecosi]|uniref:Uncharacterized protein n=1 Tax=Candidatus Jettenia ecosi TaxID=2494326 RepID=A0A533QFN7_9BACT|nr:MAG: hypothetical protein JETT_0270 [Candidatus Jettenia ecosi]
MFPNSLMNLWREFPIILNGIKIKFIAKIYMYVKEIQFVVARRALPLLL